MLCVVVFRIWVHFINLPGSVVPELNKKSFVFSKQMTFVEFTKKFIFCHWPEINCLHKSCYNIIYIKLKENLKRLFTKLVN